MKLVKTMCENYKLPYISISPTYSICKEHAILQVNILPVRNAARKRRFYSRITGYYRPVKNWNDGKAQEFADRKTYDIGVSAGRHPEIHESTSEHKDAADAGCTQQVETTKNLLFTTPTCPNCKWVKEQLNQAEIPYEIVDAVANPDMAREYHVMQAPTLIAANGKVYNGASRIKEFISNQS